MKFNNHFASTLGIILFISFAISCSYSSLEGGEINELVNLRSGASQKLVIPVLVDGRQYYVGFAYRYSGGSLSKVLCLVFDDEMERLDSSSPGYERIAQGANDLFTAIASRFEADSASGELSLLDNSAEAVSAGEKEREEERRLPTGEAIMFGSQRRALAHSVDIREDGSLEVRIIMEKPRSAMAWQRQRREVMTMAQQLALCPDLFISNGSRRVEGSVRTLSRDQREDSDGNIVYTYHMQAEPRD